MDGKHKTVMENEEVEQKDLEYSTNSSDNSSICDQCGKSFSNVYTLSAHKKQVHDKIKSFKCEICYTAFATKYKLKRHFAGVHSEVRNFICEICSNAFKTRDMLKKHERQHFKSSFKCDLCNLVFKFKSGYDYHCQQKHHRKAETPSELKISTPKKVFNCLDCTLSFKIKKDLERHVEEHRVQENIDSSCQDQENESNQNQEDFADQNLEKESQKLIDNKKDLQKHMKLVQKTRTEVIYYACGYCQKQYKSKSRFVTHIVMHERGIEMDDYDFLTESSVNEVVIEEIYNENSLEENSEDENEENADNHEDLISKSETEIEEIEENSIEVFRTLKVAETITAIPMESEGIVYGMETEDYMIQRDEGMDLFEIIAEDLEPQISDNEIIANDEENSLKTSLEVVKFRQPKKSDVQSMCCECGSTFKNNSHLSRHVMRKHRKHEYKMECDICGQRFLLNYDLKRHMTKHSNVRNYNCEKCQQKFKTEISMKNHVKNVHKTDKMMRKKFLCVHCDRSYFHSRHLDYHRRKHNGDQRYRCEICAPVKTFHYHDAIKWHRIRHHGESAPWNCKICGKKFIHEKSLHTHEKEHQGDKGSLAVTCSVCGKSVSERRHLQRHMRTHISKAFHCKCGESFKERHQLSK